MNSEPDHTDNSVLKELSKKFVALEDRVLQLESGSYRSRVKDEIENEGEGLNFKLYNKGNEQLESNIGEYGLAWLGNIVLFFGIIFLVQYLQLKGFKLISPIMAYVSVAGIFGLAHYIRNSSPYMAKIFNLNAYLLIFYISLKLHFFTADPIISTKVIGLILLFIVSSTILFLSIRKNYILLSGLSILLFCITAILSDSTHMMLTIASLISIVSIVLLYKKAWIRLVYLTIYLAYLILFFWLINNPIMGHQIQLISNHQYGIIYIYLIAAIFSLTALMPIKEDSYSSVGIIGAIVFNGLGFLFIMSLFILTFLKDNYILATGFIALYCILYSIFLKVRSKWKITAALYALFGFVSLSVCIYGMYDFPRAYFLLAIQSLLVVSMAIWFRSKFIVIMNSILFVVLLLIYLSTYAPDNAMNISLSFVALATARILNWKKERLTIRTEFIRNFYLITAFIMVLYTLFHLIPSQYITLSWTVAAVIYFGLSILLKNVKYRYLALGSMVAAALCLFINDLARIELAYRIIALLFLALISIGLSFYYAKKLKKKIVE